MIYKKAFGQHFLNDEHICREIVDLLFKHIKEPADSRVLEIGPGAGAITKYIKLHDWNVYKAVEIDKHKIDYLVSNHFLKAEQIIAEDFLKIQVPFDGNFTVIGNFPYNISTQIMFKIFEWYPQVEYVTGMFQKEVAKRIVSTHGNKDYGILSVITQVLYDCDYAFDVLPQSFTPPPKVNSGVITLLSHNNKYGIGNLNKFISFVKAAFAMRRKTLRNNLKGHFDQDFLQNEIFNKRPEQLSVREFVDLYKKKYNES